MTPMTRKIPKILHQVWVGPKPPPHVLMKTWKDYHPSWEYRLETSLRGWRNQLLIDSLPGWDAKADVIRYELLERFGGIYVDADTECVSPLDRDERFLNQGCWAGYVSETEEPGYINNAVIGARPGSVFISDLVSGLKDSNPNDPSPVATGPFYFTKIASRHPELVVFPSYYFYPAYYSGDQTCGAVVAFALHHWHSKILPRDDAGRWKEHRPVSYSPDILPPHIRYDSAFLRELLPHGGPSSLTAEEFSIGAGGFYNAMTRLLEDTLPLLREGSWEILKATPEPVKRRLDKLLADSPWQPWHHALRCFLGKVPLEPPWKREDMPLMFHGSPCIDISRPMKLKALPAVPIPGAPLIKRGRSY